MKLVAEGWRERPPELGGGGGAACCGWRKTVLGGDVRCEMGASDTGADCWGWVS